MPYPLLRRAYLIALLLLAGLAPASAQYDLIRDTVPEPAPVLTLKQINRQPKQALLWAIIPGGGQVFNNAWWKVPLVYGGLLGIVAVADYNQTLYTRYVTALEQRCLGDGKVIVIPNAECIPTENEPSLAGVGTAALVQARNGVNRNRQTAYIFVIAGYVLQAVEAFTDAHLQDFDISDDLSLQIGPVVSPQTGAGAGVVVPLGSGRQRRLEEATVRSLSAR
ncbi:DUF5683 domain-containing protein [Neolewinella litorea]|uniref:DUF5683 domain-containing protein n=1 Tax=Neolewinella litorea TaxID=2562452 RepID=A0A4S4NPD3_9BACT|nr:DUF5683 domain-containing protein [Neolewinella litorea]THH41762.1 hypothetical protein E4021_04005 [Neolewinella litorea]